MSVKMRTTCTWTERPYEASLFPGIGFGPFLRSLGGRRRRPPSGGARAIRPTGQGTVSGRQFLWGVGLPKGNGGVQRFPRGRTEIGPRVQRQKGSLTARPTRRAGTKVGLSDPTVPSGRAVAQRIKVTLGITG
ncbi:hypothetical protein KY285_010147 [Solanum tuberosum]|nr:hypothetical protein KY285_010147 [Solanum tuberosum]